MAGYDDPSSTGARIIVKDLTKRYKKVTAVEGVTFDVEPGRVTGFLGPNGAGKTTTLRMILGLVRPTAGVATIDRIPYVKLNEPLQKVGALLDASMAHPGRTGLNHLRAICAAIGISQARADEVLSLVDLDVAGNQKFKTYSLGMRQRLGIAAALVAEPNVLILDEPANGLDPEGIRWLRHLLKRLAADGRTILVSSHLLSEMELMADDVVIIANGRLITQGSIRKVIADVSPQVSVFVRTPRAADLQAALTAAGAEAVEAYGRDGLTVLGKDAAMVGRVAFSAGIELHELRAESVDLETAFMKLMARVTIK
ncbi:ABC transporter ATP-binding protein [Pilimelia anulata]|uniref:ABC transporter ATP-binding protein n=1 Tax=Pilimelia anulata TaxID=53371 RepID=A0A8J3B4C1_9ACTN|nr:ABC transporter ATP-binding protein [Pilimelia anulata]GGJ94770.1 ABC transporter ATP-binding protein [Pilimelia anulata]